MMAKCLAMSLERFAQHYVLAHRIDELGMYNAHIRSC